MTFFGANWSNPKATTTSIPALIRANDLSFDFSSFTRYCSFCIMLYQNQQNFFFTRFRSWGSLPGVYPCSLSLFLTSWLTLRAYQAPQSKHWHRKVITQCYIAFESEIRNNSIAGNKPQPRMCRPKNPSSRRGIYVQEAQRVLCPIAAQKQKPQFNLRK